MAVVASLLVMGCSTDENADPPGTTIVVGTAPLGELPGPLSDITDPPAPIEVVEDPPDVGIGEIGGFSKNNRLLLIGDAVFEAANDSDLSCSILNPKGWAVELDAVAGATVDFGFEVVDFRLDNGDFGIVGLMFGNELNGTVEEFDARYRALIEEIGPRPILAFTPASEPNDANLAILDVVRVIADETPNVRIVDWGYGTQARRDALLDPEGRPTAEGATEVWQLAAVALGDYTTGDGTGPTAGGADDAAGTTDAAGSPPQTSDPTAIQGNPDALPGECLPPTFTSATYTGRAVVGAGGDNQAGQNGGGDDAGQNDN